MNTPQTAVIALGSNLDNPAEKVQAALQAIDTHPQIAVQRISSLYRTAPVGYAEQPDFINAV
jgi:2-amino-4-hydroxy-6-hydroxymethyldihydropteridine diphosphokinase